jgi:putative ABC transport system ATP-binding protein
MPIIELKNVSKIYQGDEVKTIALDKVSFSIEQGEFVSIMGPSGSGKSTLLHILGLLDRPTLGTYHFNSRQIDEHTDDELAAIRNSDIGFIFQRFNLLKRATVYDNVLLPLHYSPIKKSAWHSLVMDSIKAVGLEHRVNHLSSQLSGGESQRVAIARAVVNKPSVIFADEPTGNLDSKAGEQIMNIIADLHEEGRTIVLITHETSAASYGNRIIRLKDGQLSSDRKQKKGRPKKFKK